MRKSVDVVTFLSNSCRNYKQTHSGGGGGERWELDQWGLAGTQYLARPR